MKIAIATLTAAMLAAATAMPVGGGAVADQASGSAISEAAARHAARSYLRREGFTSPRFSQRTARVGQARFVDGAWEVEIRFGGNIPDQSGIVIVDASTGDVRRAE